MKRAAGVLLMAPSGRVLLMRRRAGGEDHGSLWASPGGGIEDGETAEQAARREFKEETGFEFTGPLKEWTRRVKDDVDFTTFLGRGEEFEPERNEEHDGHAWVNPQYLNAEKGLIELPSDDIAQAKHDGELAGPYLLHPGVVTSLKRFNMDELEVAQAIRDGDLVSPQRFGNLLLIAMRVTGTGGAYRKALDEFVWRDPAIYMTDHFLRRCNGLEIIWEHPPEGLMLNSDQFRERMIGTSFLPYLKEAEQEVWTIARIRDAGAGTLLEHAKLSTSPGVVFTQSDGNRKVSFGDDTLLIEGDPTLLDHLAVCGIDENTMEGGLGVWDRGSEPKGVESIAAQEAPIVPEEIVSEEKDCNAIMDSILSSCDAFERKDSKFSQMVEKLEKKEGYSKEVATKTAAKIGRASIGAHEMAERAAASRARH